MAKKCKCRGFNGGREQKHFIQRGGNVFQGSKAKSMTWVPTRSTSFGSQVRKGK